MIYEITGSRILAPYVGTSTYVWTSLIGVILASLSVGYRIGGAAADRKQDAKILSLVFLAASVVLALTILVKDAILSSIGQTSLSLIIKALAATVIIFAPASVLLGFVPPYVIRLRMSSLENAGKTVGRLYALSTVGSILGTFTAGYILIPFLGSTKILYFIAISLLLMSVLTAPVSLNKTKIAAFLLLLLAVGYSEIKVYALRTKKDLHDFDTEYSRVRILRAVESNTREPLRLLKTEPEGVQSGMYLEKDELFGFYTKYYHLVRYYNPHFKNALMLGGAGYSFPKEYLRTYPDAKIEVVEIDPGMTALAKRFFKLQENRNLKITHEDGRIFLNRAENGKYDAVFIDAFNSSGNIPFHLTTIETVRHIHRILSGNGVVIVNLTTSLEGDKSVFLAAEYRTYAQVFPQVHLFRVNPELPDNIVQNVILAAPKDARFSPDGLNTDAELAEMLRHKYELNIPDETTILTDDFAPVEYFNSFR